MKWHHMYGIWAPCLCLQTISVLIFPLIPPVFSHPLSVFDAQDNWTISRATKRHIRRHLKHILEEPLRTGLWSVVSLWKCRLILPDGSALFIVFVWSLSVSMDCQIRAYSFQTHLQTSIQHNTHTHSSLNYPLLELPIMCLSVLALDLCSPFFFVES